MFPNLSLLSLHKCRPCGEMFEDFGDARGAVPAALNKRFDWDPTQWKGQRSPMCSICLAPLQGGVGGNNCASKEVEALFENIACGHCFHRDCLEQHITSGRGESSLRCPFCRRPIAQEVLDTIFDASAEVYEVPEDDGFREMVLEQEQNALENESPS